ncbi:MAG: hypothetical protein O3B31_03110 [Chloroflexi bacterium]|nr:hypothetical protein [Chloroflexota bacterium]MDA1002331.1 hypothetical protein [Chloroflexota bacterium]
MFVLGDLVGIPETDTRIPLPWYHRAPLGFKTGTRVYVSLTDALPDRPGDILISSMLPHAWNRLVRLRAEAANEMGLLNAVLERLEGWNVEIAENVSYDGGNTFAMEFLIRYLGESGRTDEETAGLEQRLDAFGVLAEARPVRPLPPIAATEPALVSRGYVVSPEPNALRKVPLEWRDKLGAQVKALEAGTHYDLARFAISANTGSRLLRLTVPRAGAFAVDIRHVDEPGMLSRITRAIRSAELNIVTSHLSKGSTPVGYASYIAILEPGLSPDAAHGRKALQANLVASIEAELPAPLRPKLAFLNTKPGETLINALTQPSEGQDLSTAP